MSRSCQSGMFSKPTTAAARTTRASPEIRSATFGFRLCGIADEPFIPCERLLDLAHLRAREVADLRREPVEEVATIANVASSSACRSRAITCVESGPARARAARRRSAPPPGSSAAYVPTVPESCPTRFDSSACARRVAVAVELEGPAGELPAERRRLGVDPVRAADADRVTMLLGARDDQPERAVDPGEDEPARILDLQRERRVDDVGGGQPVVHPAALGAELLGDGVDERREVVVGRLARSRRRARASAGERLRGSPRHPRRESFRPRPSRRERRAPPRASARACPRPTRSGSSRAWSSGRSRRTA